jgi:hypothetical protein
MQLTLPRINPGGFFVHPTRLRRALANTGVTLKRASHTAFKVTRRDALGGAMLTALPPALWTAYEMAFQVFVLTA